VGEDVSERDFMAEIKIDKNRCKGCGLCIMYCPVKKLRFSSDLNRKGVYYAQKRPEVVCVGCGNCYLICPDTCIEIYEEGKKASRKA